MKKEKLVYDYEPEYEENPTVNLEEVCTFDKYSLLEVTDNDNEFSENEFLTESQIKEYFQHFEYDKNKHYVMMDGDNMYFN